MKKIECLYYQKTNQYGEFCTHKENIDIRPRKSRKKANYYGKRCLSKFCPLIRVK